MLKDELTQMVALLDESLAELMPKQQTQKHATRVESKNADSSAASPPAPPPSPPAAAATAATSSVPLAAVDDEAPVSYTVNDTVMARWVSGDKQFYPARITSITGSSTAPIYIVKFKAYDETDTVRPKDIRPMSNKRKADSGPVNSPSTPSTPSIPPPPSFTPQQPPTPGVVSAAASIYPDAQRTATATTASAVPLDDPDKPKTKKIKAKKELEAGKAKWQDFNKSKMGKGKSKKDSMFRTPEGVHGRGEFWRMDRERERERECVCVCVAG